MSRAALKAYARYFEPLPELLAAAMEIPSRYNAMAEEIIRLENEGKIFVIRPEKPVTVSRMERNIGKLKELYGQGRDVAARRLPELKRYLEL